MWRNNHKMPLCVVVKVDIRRFGEKTKLVEGRNETGIIFIWVEC